MRKTLTAIACTAAILGWTASAAANPEKHPTEHPKDGEHKDGHEGDHKDGHDGEHKDGEHKDGHGAGHPSH
jgi:Spy/CpxP family protein refolding chaperone